MTATHSPQLARQLRFSEAEPSFALISSPRSAPLHTLPSFRLTLELKVNLPERTHRPWPFPDPIPTVMVSPTWTHWTRQPSTTKPTSLGLPGAFASGLLSQNWHTGNTSDYPPIHVHPGASATIHLNIFPYTSPNPNHHHNLFDSNIIPPTNSHHSLILGPNVTTSSSALHHHHQHHSLPQCHHCDYRFSSPYLLTDHLTRNAHHCARCRQCFPSWDEHYGCEDGGVDGYREHLWVSRHNNDGGMGGGGRILGEVEELQQERGRFDGTESWVVEERRSRHRSRTRRKKGGARRGLSRGRYGWVERPYFAVC